MEKAGTGIKRVKDACKANNNIVSFDFTDAFWVIINSNIQDVSDNVVDNVVEKKLNEVVNLIKQNSRISASMIAKEIKVSARTAQRYISELKQNNIIRRVGSDKTGYWEVIE